MIFFLEFQSAKDDTLPSVICFYCSQSIDNFNNFYQKINNIQKIILKDDYGKYSLINDNVVFGLTKDIENEVDDTQIMVKLKTEDSNIKSPAKKRVFIDTDSGAIKTRSRTQAKINIAFEQLKNDKVEPIKVLVEPETIEDPCESDKESNRSFDFENENHWSLLQL